jgi:hypothetical protein
LKLEKWYSFVVDAVTGNGVPDSILSSAESLLAIAVKFAACTSHAFVVVAGRVRHSRLWLILPFDRHLGVARHPMPYKFDKTIVDDRPIVWRRFGEQETVFIFGGLLSVFGSLLARVKLADSITEFFDTETCD